MVKCHYSTQLGLGLSHSFLKYFAYAMHCATLDARKMVEMAIYHQLIGKKF